MRAGSTVVIAKYGGLETSIPVVITPFSVKIDGTFQLYEQPPILIAGTALVPARDTLKSIGANVIWNAYNQTLTAVKDDTEINLTIGSMAATVNGTPIVLEQPPTLVNGKTLIPIRRISEAFGAKINWNEGSRTVEINVNKRKIIIGSDISYPPFEYRDPNTWKYIGFDIDLINSIAETAKLEIEIINLPFNELIPALKSKKIDAVVSAMTITEPRKAVILFSRPYFESGTVVAVPLNNNTIKSIQDLRDKKIGVISGSPGHQYANTLPEAKVLPSENPYNLFQDLANGNYEAVIHDYPIIIHHINEGCKVKIVGEKMNTEYYGIAVSKDNNELLQLIDNSLKEIEDNLTYSRIYNKWFINRKY